MVRTHYLYYALHCGTHLESTNDAVRVRGRSCMPSAPATGKGALGLHRGLQFALTDLSEAAVVLRFRPNRRYVVTCRDFEPLSKRTDTVSVFINLVLGIAEAGRQRVQAAAAEVEKEGVV